MADKSMKFYVLRTVTGKEQEVEAYIERMREVVPELKDNVGEVLVPMETYYQLNKSAKAGRVERTRPYYTGYVFVEARLIGETKVILRHIPNVLGFLGSDDQHPDVLSPYDVAQMKNLADQLSVAPDPDNLTFVEGERVKVIFGPFSGFFGEVVEVLSDRKKLKILVKVFGRETALEVDFDQVEKESLS